MQIKGDGSPGRLAHRVEHHPAGPEQPKEKRPLDGQCGQSFAPDDALPLGDERPPQPEHIGLIQRPAAGFQQDGAGPAEEEQERGVLPQSCEQSVQAEFQQAFASGSRQTTTALRRKRRAARDGNAVVGSWCILRQNVSQEPGLLGWDGRQKELRTRGCHDEQRDAAQPQQGRPEQPDTGNSPAGKHLPHRQRNAGVDRYGPFPQHGGEAAGPRPEQ